MNIIQELRNVDERFKREVGKLQTMFQMARRFREGCKGLAKNKTDIFSSSFTEFQEFQEFQDSLEDWQQMFQFLIFKGDFEEGKYKLSFLRKTKRNLRLSLKSYARTTRIDYKPLGGFENGIIKKALDSENTTNFISYGSATTCQIYKNPIIQAFFEFSLNYSYTKHIELSYTKARRIFLKACKTALNFELDKDTETQAFNNFLGFLYEESGFLDSSNLPLYNAGRPSEPEEETKEILELAKENYSDTAIARKINKGKQLDPSDFIKERNRIGKLRRDYKISPGKLNQIKNRT
ncbi:MAG: hypothetical protein K1X72_16870 [Pyrinomonadaceae bacterium]|nr:hypothetical protein [Pyrinomonadaceae bacterium]